jgi:hypothetical protein
MRGVRMCSVPPPQPHFPPSSTCYGSSNGGYCTLNGAAPMEAYEEIGVAAGPGAPCCQPCPPALSPASPYYLHPPQLAYHSDDGTEDNPSPTLFEDLSEDIRQLEARQRRPPPPGPPPPPPFSAMPPAGRSHAANMRPCQSTPYCLPPAASPNSDSSVDSLEAGGNPCLSPPNSSTGASSGDTELVGLASGQQAPLSATNRTCSPQTSNVARNGSNDLERSPMSAASVDGCKGRESGYGTERSRRHRESHRCVTHAPNAKSPMARALKRDFFQESSPPDEDIPLQLSPTGGPSTGPTQASGSSFRARDARTETVEGERNQKRSVTYV